MAEIQNGLLQDKQQQSVLVAETPEQVICEFLKG